ncbi:MAG: hypothetical protein M1335_06695, partial [Chloroflexi bacterium]|nr:hypothetical protein [Chloroflexota bacterium]
LIDEYWKLATALSHQPPRFYAGGLLHGCFVIPRSSFYYLDGFDERLSLPAFVAADLKLQIGARRGYILIAGNVLVHHFEGRTSGRVCKPLMSVADADFARLAAKYRLDPESAGRERYNYILKARSQESVGGAPASTIEELIPAGLNSDIRRPGKLIACVSVYNDSASLPHCLETLGGVDEIVVIDGAYSDFPHEVPWSTDGTVELVNELKAADSRIRLIEIQEAWKDEIEKRSAGFRGKEGDWYLNIDADEYINGGQDPEPLATLKEFLASSPFVGHYIDVDTLSATGAKVRHERYLRIIRHEQGLRYHATHFNIVSDKRMVTFEALKLWDALVYPGFRITHTPAKRPAERHNRKQAYQRNMYIHELEALKKEIERAWNDPSKAPEYEFYLTMYMTRRTFIDADTELSPLDPRFLPLGVAELDVYRRGSKTTVDDWIADAAP